MAAKRLKLDLPPEVEMRLRSALFEVGKVGARALASSIQSIAKDVKREIKKVEARVSAIEGKAKKAAETEDE